MLWFPLVNPGTGRPAAASQQCEQGCRPVSYPLLPVLTLDDVGKQNHPSPSNDAATVYIQSYPMPGCPTSVRGMAGSVLPDTSQCPSRFSAPQHSPALHLTPPSSTISLLCLVHLFMHEIAWPPQLLVLQNRKPREKPIPTSLCPSLTRKPPGCITRVYHGAAPALRGQGFTPQQHNTPPTSTYKRLTAISSGAFCMYIYAYLVQIRSGALDNTILAM